MTSPAASCNNDASIQEEATLSASIPSDSSSVPVGAIDGTDQRIIFINSGVGSLLRGNPSPPRRPGRSQRQQQCRRRYHLRRHATNQRAESRQQQRPTRQNLSGSKDDAESTPLSLDLKKTTTTSKTHRTSLAPMSCDSGSSLNGMTRWRR
ncbi:hypothetical protein ACLOJK_018673 [Asimina triloba]